MSLDLKWVSCRQHIYGSCFYIQSVCVFWLEHLIHLHLKKKKNKVIIDITKVHLVKAMVFPLVLDECESWTIKKAEH